MKRAFITGITGQTGSYLAELLLFKGYTVHGLVRRYSRARTIVPPNLAAVINNPALMLHEGDLLDQSGLDSLMRSIQPDEVYNLAAQSFVPFSWSAPTYTADVTAMGVLRILEAVRFSAPAARFYQASSSEMFGKLGSERPQDETTALHPRSPYGVAKVFGHMLTVNYRESYGMFTCSGICFNHESPRRGAEFVTQKVCQGAARIKKALRRGEKPPKLKLGNLDACRDWGHAADFAEAIWRMLQLETPDDFVIATGHAHSVRQLCQVAFTAVDLKWEDWVETDPSLKRPAEVDFLVGNASKALERLRWHSTTSFADLIDEMVAAEMNAP